MDYVSKDHHFTVGGVVLKRLRGWPMGGSLSEPATLVDLGESIQDAYSKLGRWKSTGLYVNGLTAVQTLAGVLHVDDALCISRVHCPKCILQGVSKIYPSDVGTSLEGTSPEVHFLHADVRVVGDQLEVKPHCENEDFVAHKSEWQKKSRLGLFICRDLQGKKTLRQFIWSRVISFNHTCEGSGARGATAFAHVVVEILRLNWPQLWVSSSLRSLPRRHSSVFLHACRSFGRYMLYTDAYDWRRLDVDQVELVLQCVLLGEDAELLAANGT